MRLTRGDGQGHPATIWETSLTGVNHPLGVSIDGGSLFDSTGNRATWQAVASTAAEPELPSIAQATPGATPEMVTPVPAQPADPSSAWPMLAVNNGCEPSLVSTRDGATTSLGNLCDPAFGDISGSWSSTGRVYAGIRGGQLAILGRDGHARFAVDALFGLTSCSWSPDGTWLSIAGSQTSIVHADGSGLRDLPGTATWSPDGRVIAVATTDGTLLIGAGDGTGLRPIGSFPAPATWSADGSRFAFIRNGNLWSAASDGTDVHDVTALPLGGVTAAASSPDDRWVAVEVGYGHGLWIMRPDGSERRWFGLGLSTSLGDPVWSPDATKLAIETSTNTASGQGSRVLLINADGSPAIQIVSATAPSWSPDGHFLVVTHADPPPTVDSPPGHLELMNGDGSGRRQLPTPGDGSPPVWVQ